MRFGISTHIFARFELLPTHLKKIQEAGFKEIELYANRPHFLFEKEQRIAEITQEIHNLGIKVNSVHSPLENLLTDPSQIVLNISQSYIPDTQSGWKFPLYP